MHKKEEIESLVKKYNIDLDKLKKEQIKLSKSINIKDSINFDLSQRIAGIDNIFFKNRIISAVVVFSEGEILEQEYSEDKIRFPYLSCFRAYRELPTMIEAFNKLDEKPDFVFIRGNGVLHPRGIGIASHFSLSVNVPTIGITDSLLAGEIKGEDILLNNKIAGKVIQTKQGARPIYVSPGNFISLNSAVNLVKRFTIPPHKIPEPLTLARKYGKNVRKELFNA
ncbi:MAG: endonuclease V [Nanoarchaeota archaeon]|nr:endonuclease V [Nanoarchaeota archaeon]